jgi:hypothetical protein
MRVHAKMTRAYYDALIEQKFSPAESMRLTMAWVAKRSEM